MRQIEHLLRKSIGLNAASVGSTSIGHAVRQRMRSLGLAKLEDYQQLLLGSSAEWNELVESVIVTETWFFRDAETFAALVRLILEEWLPARPGIPVRLLSIPCATGEEPYSLVMALLDAGLACDRFQVEAVDISARALAHAERGVYGRNAFRGKDLAFRNTYFRPSKEGFVLDPAVRSCVRFSRGNLLSHNFLAGPASYDFILCRNLLIYFDRPMQRRAIEQIRRLLTPSGVVFVGPVERPLFLNHGFVDASIPKASACRKQEQAARLHRMAGSPEPTAVTAGFQPKQMSRPQLSSNGDRSIPPVVRPSASLHPDLETVRGLADAGRLQEAAVICESHLREWGPSAQAYYLLGLVRDARGDVGAVDCYRRALYLEPNHYKSLLQMALLLQKKGDPARARAFRTRAQRTRTRT